MTTDTPAPDRPPYDGNRTDGFALTDAPVYLEHGTGDDDNCGPTLGLDFTFCPEARLMVDLSTGDKWNEPDLHNGVLDAIEKALAAEYDRDIPEGYGVDVRLSGDGYMWDRVNQRPEVFVTIEMWGGLYRGDESASDWIDRTTAACRYHRIIDECWTFYTATRIIERTLRKHLGMPAPCPLCEGTRVSWDDQACRNCDGTGDAPD